MPSYSNVITEVTTEMPRSRSIFLQSARVVGRSRLALTWPARLMAPPNSSSFSVSVVLPASGWEMIAKVRRRATSAARGETASAATAPTAALSGLFMGGMSQIGAAKSRRSRAAATADRARGFVIAGTDRFRGNIAGDGGLAPSAQLNHAEHGGEACPTLTTPTLATPISAASISNRQAV